MDSNNLNKNQVQQSNNQAQSQNDLLASLTNVTNANALGGVDLSAFGLNAGMQIPSYTDPKVPQNNDQIQDILNQFTKPQVPMTGLLDQTGGAGQQDINNLLRSFNQTQPLMKGVPQMPELDMNILGSIGLNSNSISQLGIPNLLQGVSGGLDPLAGIGNLQGLAGTQNLLGQNPGMQIQGGYQPQMGQFNNQMGGHRQNPSGGLIPGSAQHAQAFHAKGPENEIKIFVGGLAFQTQESDLIEYFKTFGVVADAIVMRDKQTLRGRGFGFVKMQFENQEKAQYHKQKMVNINKDKSQGHFINDKRVDVKSADDYIKPLPGQLPPTNINSMSTFQPRNQYQPQTNQPQYGIPDQGVQPNGDDSNVEKPNPYVQVIKKDDEHIFKYPKSKIFVGGLDFKLQNEDLKQHFQDYGAIESAVILKDINTGQSRGFGFVTFKDEAVAQDLIQNVQHTNICGRKVDIKSAEPKQGSSNQPAPQIPRRMAYGGQPGAGVPNQQFATLPTYGDNGGNRDRGQGNRYENREEPNEQASNNSRDDYRPQRRYDRDDRYQRNNRDRDYARNDRPERRDYRGRRDENYDDRRDYRANRSDSSSSYHNSRRDRDNRRDRRGPHHIGQQDQEEQPKEERNRSRSKSNK